MTASRPEERKYRSSPKNPGNRAKRWVWRNDTRVKKAVKLLEANLGEPLKKQQREALRVLVLTVLSQNTTDENALAAYEKLLAEFPDSSIKENREKLPRDEEGKIDRVKIRMSRVADAFPSPDWETMARASREKIQQLISPAGLQKNKSAAIKNIFNYLEDSREEFKLEQLLENNNVEEAIEILSSIRGIGVKTAAVTLLESFGADVCPVDTHVHRVSVRLGFVPPKSGRNKTYNLLQDLIPEGKGYSLHHNLLSFGRSICSARSPDCESCYLSRLCREYRCEKMGENLEARYVN